MANTPISGLTAAASVAATDVFPSVQTPGVGPVKSSAAQIKTFVLGAGDTLPVANGGTGLTTLTAGYIPFGNGTSALGSSASLFWDSANSQLDLAAGSASVPALSTTGDSNTGVYFPAADTLSLTTGGAERVRVNSVGAIGIGTAAVAGDVIRVNKTFTGSTSTRGFLCAGTVQSDCTSSAQFFVTEPYTQATSFTLTNLTHYIAAQGSFGAGSTVTNQYGFSVAGNLVGATNNYGFFSNIGSASGRWNFFANGSANNAFAGNSRFGGTSAPVATVDVTGSVAATTTILSTGATSGVGYTTGAGGAVTQASSRTTGVTINNVCGAITLVSAAGTLSWQTFTVTNSAVAATDTVVVSQKSGTDLYLIFVTNVAAGSFKITFATTGGTTTEQPVFNFAVLKAVAA